MAKIELTDLTNLENEVSAVGTINANNQRIEEAMEKALFRDGSAPAQMLDELDMNSNKIINLPAATSPTEPVRKQEFDNATFAALGLTPTDKGVVVFDGAAAHVREIKGDFGVEILDGGGQLGDPTVILSDATRTSLSKADTALQTADLGDLAFKDKAAIADIDATGTPDSTTYLRGDGSWESALGGDMLASNNLSDVSSVPTARQNLGVTVTVADRTAMKALDTSVDVCCYLAEGHRAGVFNWLSGDFSTEVTADTTEALYVESSGTASTSGAWVRASLGELNILWAGADPTNSTDVGPILNTISALGIPMHAPAGNYLLSTPVNMISGFKLRGDSLTSTVFNSSVNSFRPATTSTDYINIDLADFTVKQSSNWGSNVLTAIDFTNISYSHVRRVKCMYHQYGVFMRRTTSARQCYFNTFDKVWTFGSQYGFVVFDNGQTPNDITFIDCMSEDNGQRSSGYGMDLCGWGHTVLGYYAGLPGHTAALRLQSGCGGLNAIGIYGESTTLTQVLLDDTTGNPNTVIGVHADGALANVVKSYGTCRTLYINAGTATNVFGEVFVSASKTPPAVTTGSYDYTSFTVTGIAVGDTAKVIVPTSWPAGLVRGEPIVESGTVRLPYVNNSGGSLTPPSGTYTVAWQDRT